jgi:bifunctional non-homologous end joining protein LigD
MSGSPAASPRTRRADDARFWTRRHLTQHHVTAQPRRRRAAPGCESRRACATSRGRSGGSGGLGRRWQARPDKAARAGVRLLTRNGSDFSKRFPLVVTAVATLPVRSCLIDGEAIVSNESGLAVFNLIRSWPTNLSAVLCAFDLLELDGEDLRRLPIEARKAGLAQLPRGPHPGITLNTHYVGHGDIVYQQACKLGCEAIVSKRLGSLYRSGRSKQWLKVENPAAPAVRREAEEDWGR